MAITSANQLELLQTAEAVAREKMIDPDLVIQAMEDSLARAAKSRYGADMDIRVKIDRKTGRATFARIRTVVEDEALENHHAQLTVKQAKSYLADPAVGDEVIDEVPPVDLGRIAAQSAKQVILQKVREAERDRQFEEFRDRKGTIINGVVKREEYGNIIVDIGRGEGILRRNEKIGREAYRPGDRIRCYIKDVRREPRGPQVFLSRTDPQFMAELFKMEVPEIYDGIIEIKAVARDPGSRAKIAVISYDNSIDPVGACVGMRGSRVQAVVNELQGEKIDSGLGELPHYRDWKDPTGKAPLGKASKVDINAQGRTLKRGAQVFPVGGDTIKTTLFGRLKHNERGPGYLHFHAQTGGDYFEQLTAEAEQDPVSVEILEKHFEDLERRRYAEIARAMRCGPACSLAW